MASHDPQMLKGVLALLLLHELAREDGYGYSVLAHLQGSGFEELAEGTVYPALTRLENAGLADSYLRRSDSGPARKYYRLTEQGHAELTRRTRAWDSLVGAVGGVLGSDASDAGTCDGDPGPIPDIHDRPSPKE